MRSAAGVVPLLWGMPDRGDAESPPIENAGSPVSEKPLVAEAQFPRTSAFSATRA